MKSNISSVGTFTTQAGTLGFALSSERFREEVSLPEAHPERPHPALLYAVILWSLHLSNCDDFTQHENLYLQRSILALQDALGRDSDSEVNRRTTLYLMNRTTDILIEMDCRATSNTCDSSGSTFGSIFL